MTLFHGAPSPPSARAEVLRTWSPALDVFAAGDGSFAYAGHARGLAVVDLATPTAPQTVGALELERSVNRLAVDGERVYAGFSDDGVEMVSVADPRAPVSLGTIVTDRPVEALAAADQLLVIADSSGLRVMDVADPTRPLDVGAASFDWDPTGLLVADGFAFVADRIVGLRVFALNDSAAPVEVGRLEFRSDAFNSARGMALSGNRLYVPHGPDAIATPSVRASGPLRPASTDSESARGFVPELVPPPPPESRVLEIDVTDATAPRVAADLPQSGWPRGLTVLDDYLFVASGLARYYGTALLVRGTGVSSGFETEHSLPAVPRGATSTRSNVLVAAGDAGVLVVDLSDRPPPTLTAAPTRDPSASPTPDPNMTPSATPTGSTDTPMPTATAVTTVSPVPTESTPADMLYLPHVRRFGESVDGASGALGASGSRVQLGISASAATDGLRESGKLRAVESPDLER